MGRTLEATVLFKSLLKKGYQQVKVQLLLSIAYKMSGNVPIAEKYKAVAALSQLREQNKIA